MNARRVVTVAVLIMAEIPVAWAAAPVTPASVWREVQALQRQHAIMPGSTPYQWGSRTIDYYTVDLSNAATNRAMAAAGGIRKTTKYPNGALLVKENFNKDKKETGVTAMLKLSGFDAADRDWVMASYTPDGHVTGFGKIKSCISCHVMVKRADFVFAPPPRQLLSQAVWHAFFPAQRMSPAYVALLKKHPKAIVR